MKKNTLLLILALSALALIIFYANQDDGLRKNDKNEVVDTNIEPLKVSNANTKLNVPKTSLAKNDSPINDYPRNSKSVSESLNEISSQLKLCLVNKSSALLAKKDTAKLSKHRLKWKTVILILRIFSKKHHKQQ